MFKTRKSAVELFQIRPFQAVLLFCVNLFWLTISSSELADSGRYFFFDFLPDSR
jgi:hypothetical protein